MGLRKAALLTLAILALAPSAAQAATTFGSRLLNNPANAGECTDLPAPCTIAALIHPSAPDGDPYAGGAPVDGVITKFRTRIFGEGGAAATITLELAEVSRPNPGDEDVAVARLVVIGPTVTIPASDALETPILEFGARLPVKKGQQLALEGTNMWATYNNSGDQFSYVMSPPLVAGQGPRGSIQATGELLVQADIEPDADGDGFGDETQDACTQDQARQAAPCGPPTDLIKPTLGRISLSPRVFEEGKRTRIRYRLSEDAAVTFRVEKVATGRRVSGRCVKETRRNSARRKCKRFVKLRGAIRDAGEEGSNTLRWRARLRGKKLGNGDYRMTGRAVDNAGNRSAVRTRLFTIVE